MKNDNYIVIQGWMINELNLEGTELLIYATIHGFSQDMESRFTGSIKYLEKGTGKSRNTVRKALQSLHDKGLICKFVDTRNGVQFNEYSVTKHRGEGQKLPYPPSFARGAETHPRGGRNSPSGGAEIARGGGAETAPYNTNIDNTNQKPNKKDIGVQAEISVYPTFEDFWDLVHHKQGKAEAINYWQGKKKLTDGKKLSQADKEKIMEHYPAYIDSHEEKQYAKRPPSYIHQKTFEDEIRTNTSKAKQFSSKIISEIQADTDSYDPTI